MRMSTSLGPGSGVGSSRTSHRPPTAGTIEAFIGVSFHLLEETIIPRGQTAPSHGGRITAGCNERGASPSKARIRAPEWARGGWTLSETVQALTAESWETEVLRASGTVLVDFWAEWCAPCRTLGPVVDALATEYAGRIKVGKLNV